MRESEYLKDSDYILGKMKLIPTLKSFDDKDLLGLLNLSKVRTYIPEEIILEDGSYDYWIYYLITGEVKIVKNKKVLGVLKRPGDLFGEMSFIDGSARSASVYAVTDTVCLATDTSYLDRLKGNERNAFGFILYKIFSEVLANRLRGTNEQLILAKKEIAKLKHMVRI